MREWVGGPQHGRCRGWASCWPISERVLVGVQCGQLRRQAPAAPFPATPPASGAALCPCPISCGESSCDPLLYGCFALLCFRSFWRDFLATHECPDHLPKQLSRECRKNLRRAITCSFPPGEIVGLVEAALARAFEKQGQRWEPLPLAEGGRSAVGMADAGGAPQLTWQHSSLGSSRVLAGAACAACLLAWLVARRRARRPAAGSIQHQL